MSANVSSRASAASRRPLTSYLLLSALALPLSLVAGCPSGTIGPDPYPASSRRSTSPAAPASAPFAPTAPSSSAAT